MENNFEKVSFSREKKRIKTLEEELRFFYSKSSGPGGQNVNKVSTKVLLKLNISHSRAFTQEEKEIIISKLKNRIDNEGNILIYNQESRSQAKNKQRAKEKLFLLIEELLKMDKKRIKTKKTKISQEKRLSEKKKISQKKQMRKKIKNY